VCHEIADKVFTLRYTTITNQLFLFMPFSFIAPKKNILTFHSFESETFQR
jgi:hypothetical protein